MTTEEKIKVMQAFLDGKQIEMYSNALQSWVDYKSEEEPLWNWKEFNYRIKEEPKVIPYSYEDDLLGMSIESKDKNERFLILGQNKEGVTTIYPTLTYQGLFELYNKSDGTPCGKLSE